ncbi:MAG: glycosyltransferase family 2 protein [Microgenomates group bacterium]
MNKFLLSLIIPVFNEEKNILPLINRLNPIIKNYQYEIIFVDDGSTDNTVNQIKKIIQKNKKIKLISFTRNFGHQIALTAGYLYSKGDVIISMDADLQDPPEIIPQMLEKWKKGAKIVYAKRKERKVDSFLKRLTAFLFYRLINFLSDTPIPDNVGDFRLLDKEVVVFLNQLKEKSRFLRGLVAWPGFTTEYVYFNREKRFAGETHYPFAKMINFAIEGITSFSTKPLRLVSYLGFITAFLGFLGIIYAVLGKIFLPKYWVTGWTALFVAIMFLGGIQLITIGIIGEYIGKIYQQVQERPPFLIKEKINL